MFNADELQYIKESVETEIQAFADHAKDEKDSCKRDYWECQEIAGQKIIRTIKALIFELEGE